MSLPTDNQASRATAGLAAHPLTRRGVLTAAGTLAALVAASRCVAREAGTTGAGFTSEIAPGVFVHKGNHALFAAENQGDISNCGFVVGRTGVAVIDVGGSVRVGAALKRAIANVTDVPVRYVINTHMHPDHVFGNAAFRADGVTFVGHKKLPRGLSARSERYIGLNKDLLGPEAFQGIEIILPTLLVEQSTVLDLGGRTLTLEAQPTAHTDNDLLVRCNATDTLFMGDLLFSEHVPTIDGSIRGWLALLSALEARPAARVVPGHGPSSMGWPHAAVPLRRYLSVVATEIRALIKANKTLSEAVAMVGSSEESAWLLFRDYHARNVSAAFAELEWE